MNHLNFKAVKEKYVYKRERCIILMRMEPKSSNNTVIERATAILLKIFVYYNAVTLMNTLSSLRQDYKSVLRRVRTKQKILSFS